MNSTSAEAVIIQPLWPGPDVVVRNLGVPLVTYASRSATRAARSGAAGAGAAAGAAAAGATAAGAAGAGGGVWAKATLPNSASAAIEDRVKANLAWVIVRSWLKSGGDRESAATLV